MCQIRWQACAIYRFATNEKISYTQCDTVAHFFIYPYKNGLYHL